ncbi:MarR family protein [Promicromonospora umidemergens]|uniref:HTH marR-type domain-containing protein n=2 Tax=Promicromonospora TaxID=43676 RepID=A0ABP8XHD6_9MICO|nr:helix-turn-helix domain-containing protein [Promicromonospora umidemergens]MCI2267206.1 winged helix-turn-helix domain-containing protein [Sediminivirga luteola]MCP2287030.1 MarR family protein [Promicromonospora umidemergens]
MTDWTFLTNHARVLLCIARDDQMRLPQIADEAGITERATQRIITELERAGYLERNRDGLTGRYRLNGELPFRPRTDRDVAVGEVLDLLEHPTRDDGSVASVARLEPRLVGTTSAWMVLLVRSVDDLDAAVPAVNDYLNHLREGLSPASRHDSTLLGIWVRGDLEEGLPEWLHYESATPAAAQDETSQAAVAEAMVGVRRSVSLSGLWTLCWIDGPLLRATDTTDQARRHVLDTFVAATSEPRGSRLGGIFYASFAASRPSKFMAAEVADLRARHPRLVADRWFVVDDDQGIQRLITYSGVDR